MMLMLFLKQARGQSGSQPKILGDAKYFDFKRAIGFC